MEQLPVQHAFTKEDLLYEGDHTVVYRTTSADHNQPVIAKVLRDEHPTQEVIQQFYNEFNISNQISGTSARKALAKGLLANKYAMILEYHEGFTLKQLIATTNWTNEQKITLAVDLTDALDGIHRSGVIHKDFNPNNILVDPTTLRVKVIDFGISSRIDYKTEKTNNPEKLQGTLLYISPEQTGRMNRFVDKRSDLYSLGVILYELFSGQLPFEASEMLELVHQHIAQTPVSPQALKADIPEMISDIILKLMSKNAEDRYQSAFGLKHDLSICLHDIEKGTLTEIQLGTADFTGRLVLPQKLYGRTDALNQLTRQYFTAAVGGIELCYVGGAPGTGKSALVQELSKHLAAESFLYTSGKFDKLQRNIPYSAIIQAFKGLVDQLLTEKPEKLAHLREALKEALGEVGRVVTDVVPSLELIIGEQPALRELGAMERQNRFNFAVLRFVQTLCTAHSPMIFFLDDLQWADTASLELIEKLATDTEGQKLFIIAAYRDTEVDATHPFTHLRARIEGSIAGTSQEINIGNLVLPDLVSLLADTLLCTSTVAAELAQLIHVKTQGNAFFTGQFIKTLEERELLSFDYDVKAWKWELKDIQQLEITDNVVDLMTQKLQNLSTSSLQLLQQASCIGTQFRLDSLATISDLSPIAVVNLILPAIENGLVMPLGNGAELVYNEELIDQSTLSFAFIHDRVRQAAYEMIDEGQKKSVHLSIGRLLLEHAPVDQIDSNLFDIVNHFKVGLDLITDVQEREQIAHLTFKAGQKAKNSNAYEAAIESFNDAVQLFGTSLWNDEGLGRALYTDLSESYYLTSNFDASEVAVKILLDKCYSKVDKVLAMSIQQEILKGRTDFQGALKIALEALKLLGEPLPEKPTKFHVLTGFIKAKMAIGKKTSEQLAALPVMENEEKLMAMRILARTGLTAYVALPDLLPLISLKELQLSIKYGNTQYSSQSYAIYGFINGMMGKPVVRQQFEALSWKVFHQFGAPEMEGKVIMVSNGLINHWHIPLKDTIEPYKRALQQGRENGDLDVQFTSTILHWDHAYFMGESYPNLLELATEYKQFNTTIKQQQAIHIFGYFEKLMTFLVDEDPTAIEYISANFDAAAFIANSDRIGLSKVQLLYARTYYQFGIYDKALECIDTAKKHYEMYMGLIYQWVFHYHEALIGYAFANQQKAPKALARAKKSHKKLAQWAKVNPTNFDHIVALLDAEAAKLKGDTQTIISNYTNAIQLANKHGFKHDEALANEQLALYYLDLNQQRVAQLFLSEALHLYRQLGATAKAKALTERHPGLLVGVRSGRGSGATTTIHTTTQGGVGMSMDFSTVTKAATAISSEIVLEKLLEKLIVLSVENAGAETGYLVMHQAGDYIVQAGYQVGVDTTTLENTPLKDHPSISEAIVHYVLRTKESIVLSNAVTDGRFKNDYGVKKLDLKSVLCIPINNQGKLLGVVYLVNNLTEGAFTPERIEVLQILAGQAAVSLDNAYLYKNLEIKVEERTEEIRHQKEIIEEKSNDILSSIHYAKRIQQAILPRKEEVDSVLNQFILFQPKDIVSGDFYWFHALPEVGTERSYLFAAADCTGHGVPGALMSMVGSNILNQIVNERHIVEPAAILEQLNAGVATALQQTGSGNEGQTRDGMDIALCKITYAENGDATLRYSGAHRPLWLVRTNGDLDEVKANKQAIGGGYDIEPFTEHEVPVAKGDMLYLFSDGYADQFGGDRGKKYMTSQLKESFIGIREKPEKEQEKILQERFETWRGEHEQIDDVLIFGVRV